MTVPVPPEEEDPACDCGRPETLDITWSPVSQKYMCHLCRALAAAAAHRITLAEQRALDASAREAS